MTDTIPLQTEKQFMDAVLELAEVLGWLCYHTHDSRDSRAGFPDIVMLRRGKMIVAELKRSPKDRMTPAQSTWLLEFAKVGHPSHSISAYRWDPTDWPEIRTALAA